MIIFSIFVTIAATLSWYQVFRCEHRYRIIKEDKITRHNNVDVVGTFYVSRCDVCGKIKSDKCSV